MLFIYCHTSGMNTVSEMWCFWIFKHAHSDVLTPFIYYHTSGVIFNVTLQHHDLLIFLPLPSSFSSNCNSKMSPQGGSLKPENKIILQYTVFTKEVHKSVCMYKYAGIEGMYCCKSVIYFFEWSHWMMLCGLCSLLWDFSLPWSCSCDAVWIAEAPYVASTQSWQQRTPTVQRRQRGDILPSRCLWPWHKRPEDTHTQMILQCKWEFV